MTVLYTQLLLVLISFISLSVAFFIEIIQRNREYFDNKHFDIIYDGTNSDNIVTTDDTSINFKTIADKTLGGLKMNINEFAQKIAKLEKGKKEVNIAQIKEIVKIINNLLKPMGIDLYKVINKMEK